MKMFLVITAILGMTLNLNANDIMKSQGMINSTPNLEFIENRGQIADQHGNVNQNVLFIADVPYGRVTIRRDGISYSFVKYDDEIMSKKRNQILSRDISERFDEMEFEPIPAEIYRVDMRFNSSNFNPKVEAFEISNDYNNYYLAHCPDGIHYVRKYRTVKLIDVYPDIDFVIYANNDGLVQYDFVVKPGANPNSINFAFEGAENVVITNTGDLRIETPLGRIEQKAPIAYQPNNLTNYLNSRDYTSIQSQTPNPHSQFIKNSDNSISFALSNYNPSKPLIIDPPTRLWGTYYGGNDWDEGNAVATDENGNVYLVGVTHSTNSIVTSGSYQSTISGGKDAFLVKFNKDGGRQWGTYYGGSNDDSGNSVITNIEGSIYLAGTTNSDNTISTAEAHQITLGGRSDAFLVKFNTDGVRQWGTYYGGSYDEIGSSLTSDGSGNIYLAGNTASAENISTEGAYQTSIGSGFLVKFNSNGERLWGTYYDNNNKYHNIYSSIVCDNDGNIYMAGASSSNEGIATDGSHQPSLEGHYNAFLVKFNSNGERLWGTYYGGNGYDYGNSIACDSQNNVYLTGRVSSGNGIATDGAHQSIYGGSNDAFLVKFNAEGVRQWGTYYGGNNFEIGYSVFCDKDDNIYISGTTDSRTAIATEDSHQSNLYDLMQDAFLVKFNTDGVRQWGTYYGGFFEDVGKCVVSDSEGNVFLAGLTMSWESIATAGSHQNKFGAGYGDAFLVKFKSETTNIRENLDTHNTDVELLISPLPASSEVIVSLVGAEVPKRSNVELYNQLGQLLLSTDTNENTIRLDTSELPSGTYQLIWSSNGTIISDKLLIVQ